MWGRGQRGNIVAYSALTLLSVTSPAIHKQIGPFCCLFLGGWLCVYSRALWVSPTNSPVIWQFLPQLQLPQVFTDTHFQALVSHSGIRGCLVCLTPHVFLPGLFTHDCGIAWCASHQLACPVCNLAAPPLCSGCMSLPLLPVCMNVLGCWTSPYSSVFCQFWVVFKFVVVLLWLYKEAKSIHLCLHLGLLLFFFLNSCLWCKKVV